MKKGLLVAVALGAALAVGLGGAWGGAQATPGVTAKVVTVGGTFPFTGPASSYAPIPRGMGAEFSYENATKRGADKARGCGGRQVKWIALDDGYNPTQTVTQTIRLVKDDKVLTTLGGLGTEPQQAVRAYLNANKVPQLYVSTGATFWGADQKQFPWSIGWQPDYQGEGAIYGRRIKANAPNSKIAVLYQNDDYGKDYIAGLEAGLGKNKSQIVATRGYNVLTDTSVAAQLLALRQSGADTLMIFATPTFTIRTYATLKAIGWNPQTVYLNSVSATDTFMGIAVGLAGAATVNGSISVQYLKDPANSDWDNDAGMKLYKAIMAKYYPSGKVTDGLYLYGVAKARSFCNLLDKVGKNLTRSTLMAAALNWKETDKDNPFFLPGVSSTTSKNDKFPISAQRLIQFNNGTWKPVGNLVDPRPAKKQ
jgi:ABC-type branched-subunit amino acid transport system substrate-binding protein